MFKNLIISVACFAILFSCTVLDPGESGNLVPRTVDEDSSLPSIAVNGTELHSESFGNPGDSLIVFLHGGPGGDYRSLLPYQGLADFGYHVVFYDQRGAGLSQRHDKDELSLSLYMEDLRQVINHYSQGSEPVVLIGQSFGAMLVSCFIHTFGDYGGRLSGAIFSEPGGFSSDVVQEFLDRLIAGIDFFSESANESLWKNQIFTPIDHAELDYQIASMEAQAEKELGHYLTTESSWRYGGLVSEYFIFEVLKKGFDWTPGLEDFDRPVLFIRGEKNELMPLSHQQSLADNYSQALPIISIQGAGHDVMQSHYDRVVSEILDYLNDLGV